MSLNLDVFIWVEFGGFNHSSNILMQFSWSWKPGPASALSALPEALAETLSLLGTAPDCHPACLHVPDTGLLPVLSPLEGWEQWSGETEMLSVRGTRGRHQGFSLDAWSLPPHWNRNTCSKPETTSKEGKSSRLLCRRCCGLPLTSTGRVESAHPGLGLWVGRRATWRLTPAPTTSLVDAPWLSVAPQNTENCPKN